jgi:hypothetical protein
MIEAMPPLTREQMTSRWAMPQQQETGEQKAKRLKREPISYNAAQQPVRSKVNETFLSVFGFLILLGCPLSIGWLIWNATPDKVKYNAIYQVGMDHIYSDSMPKDCNWDKSPIGDKGCHYIKQVIPAKNDDGVVTVVYITWDKVQD